MDLVLHGPVIAGLVEAAAGNVAILVAPEIERAEMAAPLLTYFRNSDVDIDIDLSSSVGREHAKAVAVSYRAAADRLNILGFVLHVEETVLRKLEHGQICIDDARVAFRGHPRMDALLHHAATPPVYLAKEARNFARLYIVAKNTDHVVPCQAAKNAIHVVDVIRGGEEEEDPHTRRYPYPLLRLDRFNSLLPRPIAYTTSKRTLLQDINRFRFPALADIDMIVGQYPYNHKKDIIMMDGTVDDHTVNVDEIIVLVYARTMAISSTFGFPVARASSPSQR